jgi:hypothetical protein
VKKLIDGSTKCNEITTDGHPPTSGLLAYHIGIIDCRKLKSMSLKCLQGQNVNTKCYKNLFSCSPVICIKDFRVMISLVITSLLRIMGNGIMADNHPPIS